MLADDRPILCFDIGGTSTKTGIFDPKTNRLSDIRKFSNSELRSPKDLENFVLQIVEPVWDRISAVAFASTGRVTRDYKVAYWGPFKFLERLDFLKIAGYSQCPAVALNDASAAAYAELCSSGGKLNNFLFLTIGTGIGAGIVLDGKLVEGEHGFAGEFGKIAVYDPSASLYYEIEDLCSGTAIARAFSSDISELRYKAPERIWHAAAYSFRHLSLCVQNAVKLLDINILILGGGVAELSFPFYKRELGKNVKDLSGKSIKVRKARYGWKAGLVGAGFYAKHQLL